MLKDKKFIEYCKEKKTILSPEYVEGEGWFLGNNVRCAPLPSAYFVSADMLVETGFSNDSENFMIAPALYLYRHAVELSLKDLLLDLGIDNYKHSIQDLYFQLLEKLENLNPDLMPDEDVFNAIMQFHCASPESTEFRYDNQRQKDLSLLGGDHLLFCNIKNAQYHAGQIIEYYKKTKMEIKRVVAE